MCPILTLLKNAIAPADEEMMIANRPGLPAYAQGSKPWDLSLLTDRAVRLQSISKRQTSYICPEAEIPWEQLGSA